jgi:hypothetical protein
MHFLKCPDESGGNKRLAYPGVSAGYEDAFLHKKFKQFKQVKREIMYWRKPWIPGQARNDRF